MNHFSSLRHLPAYVDGELDWFRRALVRRHSETCPTCLALLEAHATMRTAIRTNLKVHRAPPNLASRIGSALPREATAPPVRRAPVSGFGGAALAGMAAGIVLTIVVTRSPDPLPSDVVAAHVRSMLADHLTDVPSTDQHTVKPWLSARLDLSPVVKDLKEQGYPLVGGRLDIVQGHRAAALVYRRDRHVINLFVFTAPGAESAAPDLATRDGFNVVRWRMGGLSYVAVSDVEASQLLAFARLVEGG